MATAILGFNFKDGYSSTLGPAVTLTPANGTTQNSTAGVSMQSTNAKLTGTAPTEIQIAVPLTMHIRCRQTAAGYAWLVGVLKNLGGSVPRYSYALSRASNGNLSGQRGSASDTTGVFTGQTLLSGDSRDIFVHYDSTSLFPKYFNAGGAAVNGSGGVASAITYSTPTLWLGSPSWDTGGNPRVDISQFGIYSGLTSVSENAAIAAAVAPYGGSGVSAVPYRAYYR